MRKKLISLLLVLIFCVSIATTVFAASSEAKLAADKLYDMGLFKGVGYNADGSPNYDLDRGLTRAEAVTLLVRLLGREKTATVGSYTTPFKDVPDWAKPYVGYAYENKLTNGVSATSFGSEDLVSATQFLTFVLRALGYDSNSDFKWDSAWTLTDKLDITKGQYGADTKFLRGDAVIVAYNATITTLKSSDLFLHEVIAANIKEAEEFEAHKNDYVNGKNGISMILPDEWTLSSSEYTKDLYYHEPGYYLTNVFKDCDDTYIVLCNNTKTKSSIIIASATLPEKYTEMYTLEALRAGFDKTINSEESILENHTTILGHEYAGLIRTKGDQYLFASVFNGELVVIYFFLEDGNTYEELMGFFE